MERREFSKLGLLASGALILPLGCMGNSTPPIIGGNEKLFLNEQDFERIRENIKQFGWAKKRFEVLKNTVSRSEDDFFKSHWKGSWRQWSTGQYLKYIAIHYRLTGDDTKLIQIKEHLISEFKLNQMEVPYNKLGLPTSKEIWSWGMSRMNYFWTWDMVKNHPIMSSFKDALMIRFEEITQQYLRYEDKFIGRLGNTQFWGISAMGVMGFLTSNEEAIDRSINGKFGLKTALDNKIRDGKFWPEPSNYSIHYVLCAMSLLAEASRVSEYEDLYHYVSPSGGSIKGMIDGLFELCYPQGLLASNGDAAHLAILNSNGEVLKNQYSGGYLFDDPADRVVNKFEIFYKAYKDPKYAWVINKQKERFSLDVTVWGDNTLIYGIPLENIEAPSFQSSVFPEHGHAMISTVEGKNYWNGKNNVLHVRNGNTTQYHGNDDPFHFDLIVNGKMIYLDWDLGWNYLAPKPSRNNRNKTPISHYSIGHNTVLVDKKGPDKRRYQLPQRIEEFSDINFSDIKDTGRMKTISLEGSIYEGVNQRRTFGITPDYLIDIFECSSDEIHTYDYILHNEGAFELYTKIDLEDYDGFDKDYKLEPIDSESTEEGNSWLRKGKKGLVHNSWQGGFFDEEGKRVKLDVGGEKGTEVFVTNTPMVVDNGWNDTPENLKKLTKPMLIIRRECKSTKFIVVHQLTNLDKPFKVIRGENNIEIMTEDYSDTIELKGNRLLLTSK
ncbi:alginate lyase family protein [Algibacter sp. L4_22]|uniref:alginate lyase family protein n=1 Tax=Algibacter sp. L4_22 TaxID=2942477 RepID=UPI00201B78CE|nr:alginate lyase family protein [Algibacter sp. L4_22]MCL5130512.1 alginate lyase family protein [Algibacter sp. L4_22]